MSEALARGDSTLRFAARTVAVDNTHSSCAFGAQIERADDPTKLRTTVVTLKAIGRTHPRESPGLWLYLPRIAILIEWITLGRIPSPRETFSRFWVGEITLGWGS